MSVSAEKYIELQTELTYITSQVSSMVAGLSLAPWPPEKHREFDDLITRACDIAGFLEDNKT